LLTAAYLRHFAFFLPSHIGDSSAYQSLAMKLNHGFMRHYDIFHYSMVRREGNELTDYVWEEDPLKWNARRIRAIYHRPLHLQPPLYPILIWISHGIFNRGEPYTSVAINKGAAVVRNPPWHFLKAQFYAIVVPYAFSLFTIVWVYLFCLKFFSWREGLLATLLMVSNPLDIAVSSKLYADGILASLCFFSLTIFLCSLKEETRRSWVLAALAGFFLGLAYLTKVTGILFAFGFIAAALVNPHGAQYWLLRLFDRRLLLAGLICLLTVSPWLLLFYRTYDTFFLNTPADTNNSWYRLVFGIPVYSYLVGFFWFLPPTAVGWAYGLLRLPAPRRYPIEFTFLITSAIYLLAFIIFVKTGTSGVEPRYLLPIYPMLSILTGCGLVQALRLLKKPRAMQVGYALIFLALLYSGWRSVEIGLYYSFRYLTLIRPFGI
jgi:hypothetical protein